MNRIVVGISTLSLACALAGCTETDSKTNTVASAAVAEDDIAARESAVPSNPLKDAYFGETHVHSSYSLDAYIGGNRNGPDGAYRLGRGEEIMIGGQKHRLKRPLDFMAVSDHAEYIGEMYSTQMADAPGYNNPLLVQLRGLTSVEDQRSWFVKYVVSNNRSAKPQHPEFYAGPETTRSAWQLNRKITDDFYAPGKFTTLHAFEWSAAPNGGNMHRNVFFRDNDLPDQPFSAIDSPDEEQLWAWIISQRTAGKNVFAIPHNSNGSKTQMFEPVDNSGNPLTAEYAKMRTDIEPLIEMMQIKGASEVHRKFWPTDEFADFENADSMARFSKRVADERNYVRYALKEGVRYQGLLGANPYRYGFVGGSDNHNSGASDTAEDEYIGSHGVADNSVMARRTETIDGWLDARDSNPGALTGVWAEKNTRAAIWDAMKARETFATSGTRMKVRMFGGARLAPVKDARQMATDGYRKGVPMGSSLSKLQSPPAFTVYASKDPDGANLDRIQIVKGWVDASGKTHEKVINVAWSGNRKLDGNGNLPKVGNTVDLTTARYSNSIGSAFLMGRWVDKEWKASENAFYYVRALEIPTPRYSTYDAVRAGLPLLTDVPAIIQERAWGSPIWYMSL